MAFLYILNSDAKVHIKITVIFVDEYDVNKYSYTVYVYYTVPS